MELVRRAIPELSVKKIRKGLKSIVERSFPYGDKNLFRVYQYEKLELALKFNEGHSGLQVMLNTDVSGQWEDIPFFSQNQIDYKLVITPTRSGVFRFKVKYSYNEGQFWYWDSVPHTTMIVDPEGLRGIRIYTMIPSVSGHIGDWIKNLDHIKGLGFDAVHLLPITELDLSESPYAARDLFKIDDTYANPDDPRPVMIQFEDFVRRMRDLSLRLCVDLVMNHIGSSSNMAKYCPEWIATDPEETDSLKRAGCWDQLKWVAWRDLVLIKYDHANKKVRQEIWGYMKDYALFWANYANYTKGIVRLDNLHSINIPFFRYLMTEMRNEFPDLVVYAELFTDPETTERMVGEYSLNLLLATPWFNAYAEQTRNFVLYLHNIYGKIRYLFPLNSHDSGTPAQEYGGVDTTPARYVICSLMGTGQTGISQGVEFGVPEKIKFIGKQNKWHFHAGAWGRDFGAFFHQIHQFIDENKTIFQTGGNIRFLDNNHFAVLGCYRYDPKNLQKGYLIYSNVDTTHDHKIKVKLPFELAFLNDRLLTDRVTGEVIKVSKHEINITIKPLSFKIFVVD